MTWVNETNLTCDSDAYELPPEKSMVLLPLEEALISDACLPRSSTWMTKGANDETLPAVT
jgi:hypothetical protein